MLGFFTEEIPKTCIECRHALCNQKGDKCNLSNKSIEAAIEEDKRSINCPLRKVPSLRSPHSRNWKRVLFYKGYNEAVKIIAAGKRRPKKEDQNKHQPELNQLTIEDVLKQFS